MRAVGCLLVFSTHTALILFAPLVVHMPERSYAQYLLRALYGFFIISGIVLTLPFIGDRPKAFSAKKFYSRRFFRLYPMYWMSLLFALALRFATHTSVVLPGTTLWAERFWTTPLTPAILLQEFSGSLDIRGLLFPGYWTFACEIQICLLFPIILFMVKRTRHWSVAVAVLLAAFIATHYIGENVFLLRSLSYFIFGAYVAKYYSAIKTWLRGLSRPVAWGGFAFFVLFMAVAPIAWPPYRVALILFDVFLALLMVMVQTFAPLAALSRLRPVRRMANLSFAFYLVQLPILTSVAYVVGPRIHSPVLCGIAALSLTIAVAWLGWRFVEVPIRNWGKKLATDQRTLKVQGVLESSGAAAS